MMSNTAKKVLLIFAGLLVCALTYFFVFQPNLDETTALESETSKLQSEVNRLTALQAQISQLQPLAEQHEVEMDMYFAEYPSRMTEQKAIYNIYRMMVDTGIRVDAIQPNRDMTFMQGGTLAGADGAFMSDNMEAATGAGASAEVSPEAKVPVNEMIGKYATYNLTVHGTKTEIYDAMDWISENSEHMSIGPVSFSFDPSTGKLTGSMSVYYYSMNGNGIAYVEPDTSEIVIGSEDIFGYTGKNPKRRSYQEK